MNYNSFNSMLKFLSFILGWFLSKLKTLQRRALEKHLPRILMNFLTLLNCQQTNPFMMALLANYFDERYFISEKSKRLDKIFKDVKGSIQKIFKEENFVVEITKHQTSEGHHQGKWITNRQLSIFSKQNNDRKPILEITRTDSKFSSVTLKLS